MFFQMFLIIILFVPFVTPFYTSPVKILTPSPSFAVESYTYLVNVNESISIPYTNAFPIAPQLVLSFKSNQYNPFSWMYFTSSNITPSAFNLNCFTSPNTYTVVISILLYTTPLMNSLNAQISLFKSTQTHVTYTVSSLPLLNSSAIDVWVSIIGTNNMGLLTTTLAPLPITNNTLTININATTFNTLTLFYSVFVASVVRGSIAIEGVTIQVRNAFNQIRSVNVSANEYDYPSVFTTVSSIGITSNGGSFFLYYPTPSYTLTHQIQGNYTFNYIFLIDKYCAPFYTLDNNTCISTVSCNSPYLTFDTVAVNCIVNCPYPTVPYKSPLSNYSEGAVCATCAQLFEHCIGCNTTHCLLCTSPFVLVQGQCACPTTLPQSCMCPPSTLMAIQLCLPCSMLFDSYCQQCDAVQCLFCAANTTLNYGLCRALPQVLSYAYQQIGSVLWVKIIGNSSVNIYKIDTFKTGIYSSVDLVYSLNDGTLLMNLLSVANAMQIEIQYQKFNWIQEQLQWGIVSIYFTYFISMTMLGLGALLSQGVWVIGSCFYLANIPLNNSLGTLLSKLNSYPSIYTTLSGDQIESQYFTQQATTSQYTTYVTVGVWAALSIGVSVCLLLYLYLLPVKQNYLVYFCHLNVQQYGYVNVKMVVGVSVVLMRGVVCSVVGCGVLGVLMVVEMFVFRPYVATYHTIYHSLRVVEKGTMRWSRIAEALKILFFLLIGIPSPFQAVAMVILPVALFALSLLLKYHCCHPHVAYIYIVRHSILSVFFGVVNLNMSLNDSFLWGLAKIIALLCILFEMGVGVYLAAININQILEIKNKAQEE